MHFFKDSFFVTLLALVLCACTSSKNILGDMHNEGKVGVPLDSMSGIQTPYGTESQQIFLVDKLTRRIHQFDLNSLEHVRKLELDSPDDTHYVLHQADWQYVIDLSDKNFSILGFNGVRQKNPIELQGAPTSYAFDATHGYLLVADSNSNMGVLKISPTGEVLDQLLLGSRIEKKYNIRCGDITNTGLLILAVRDSETSKFSIVSIDLQQSFAQKKAVTVLTPIDLDQVVWLSPLPQNQNQFLIKSSKKVSLFDLQAGALTSIDIGDWVVEKYSKVQDPHILIVPTAFWSDSSSSQEYYRKVADYAGLRKLIYVEAGQLKVQEFQKDLNTITSSQLNVENDEWRITTNNSGQFYFENDYNKFKNSREFQKIRLSDLLVTQSLKIDDDAQIEIAHDYIFSLYPTKLGYVRRTNLKTKTLLESKLFNLGDI